MEKEANRQIIQLLVVVFSAIALAVIVLGGMLWSWGPTGRYLAKNVLLSPEVAKKMTFQDYNPNTGEKMRLVFDHVEFTYYDPNSRQFQKVNVSVDEYAEFYNMIGNDRSIAQPDDTIVGLFSQKNPAKMMIMVRGKNLSTNLATPFQEADFVFEGNYYRVELHQESQMGEWTYFYHPDIYQHVMKLFVSHE